MNTLIVLLMLVGVWARLDISAYRKYIKSTTFQPKVIT